MLRKLRKILRSARTRGKGFDIPYSVKDAAVPDGFHPEVLRFEREKAAGKKTILFVCTGNAARSQMAEGIVNHLFGDDWAAFSGGVMPMEIRKDVITVMKELGLDMSGRQAKHVSLFCGCRLDRVVILCSDAEKFCPDFPYAGRKDAMNFDDPLSRDILNGGHGFGMKRSLRRLRDEMKTAITLYLRD
jgi:arsenate reductase